MQLRVKGKYGQDEHAWIVIPVNQNLIDLLEDFSTTNFNGFYNIYSAFCIGDGCLEYSDFDDIEDKDYEVYSGPNLMDRGIVVSMNNQYAWFECDTDNGVLVGSSGVEREDLLRLLKEAYTEDYVNL